mmetsp:Transcript_795/g.2053  ORF Transcript_795/g.2053 Transcript_795/m.2053 type:complete len:358 (+) Transcript_795:88-1161(+)
MECRKGEGRQLINEAICEFGGQWSPEKEANVKVWVARRNGAQSGVVTDRLIRLLRLGIRQHPTIIDGGLSAELESIRAAPLPSDLWTGALVLDDPLSLQQAHANFVRAGARLVTSASYQLNMDNLQTHRGLSRSAACDTLVHSVRLAREAVPDDVLVACSLGAYGASLSNGAEYTGEYPGMTEDGLYAFHKDRLSAVREAGADVFVFETIPSGPEVRAILRLAKESDINCFVSFQCRDETSLGDGTPVSTVARCCHDAQIAGLLAVGTNCVSPSVVFSVLSEVAKACPSIPLLCYPNSGEVWDAVGRKWLPATSGTSLLSALPTWSSLGPLFIGGCCRVDAALLARIAAQLSTEHKT